MPRRIYLTVILTLVLLISVTTTILFFARGYKIDIRNRDLTQTGIISITSTPQSALIYINNIPQNVTNNSITGLVPDTYSLRLEKAGYHQWHKNIPVKAGEISQVDALLVSLFPEIKPLTITGAKNPIFSPDNQKIVYATGIDAEEPSSVRQAGIWLLNLAGRPFNLLSQPSLLIADTETQIFSSATIEWSPDAQIILITLINGETYQLDIQSKELIPIESVAEKEALLASWDEETSQNDTLLRERFPQVIQDLLPNGTKDTTWSPDQTKILYSEVTGDIRTYRVIDLNPTTYLNLATAAESVKRYTVFEQPVNELAVNIQWYPDSKHLSIFEPRTSADLGQLSLIEIDGENKTSIFSGKIIDGQFFPHPDGNKIIILTNFTTDDLQNNLYAITLY